MLVGLRPLVLLTGGVLAALGWWAAVTPPALTTIAPASGALSGSVVVTA